MTKPRTLYISDLDGTLLGRDAELSAYTRDTLNGLIADGLNFSAATARTAASTGKILAGLRLNIPIVLMNGVLIYDTEQGRYIRVNSLSARAVGEIIAALKKLNATGLMYELKDETPMTYYESLERKPIRDFVEERKARYYKAFRRVDSFADVPPENVIYFTLLDSYERVKPVHDALSGLTGITMTMYNDIYDASLWYLEIFSEEASKRRAVEFLRKEYGFEHITGFGDNLNDLPLFEACDRRVAVENAKPEVKAAADFVCGANESDGVVKWIRENAEI